MRRSMKDAAESWGHPSSDAEHLSFWASLDALAMKSWKSVANFLRRFAPGPAWDLSLNQPRDIIIDSRRTANEVIAFEALDSSYIHTLSSSLFLSWESQGTHDVSRFIPNLAERNSCNSAYSRYIVDDKDIIIIFFLFLSYLLLDQCSNINKASE